MTGLSQPVAGIINILRDTFLQGIEGFVLNFFSQLMQKTDFKSLSVKVTLAIQQMNLKICFQSVIDGRPRTNIGNCRRRLQPRSVYANSKHTGQGTANSINTNISRRRT